MNRGKFASLVLLSAFTQGCISSGIVGASNLADTQDESANIYENSAGKGKDSFGNSTGVNDEDAGNKPGDNIDTENDKDKTTDDSDGPNINDVKPTDTGENSIEENSQAFFVNKDNKDDQKKGMGSVRNLAAVGVGGIALGGAGGAGTVKLIDSSGEKAQEQTDPTPKPDIPVNNPDNPGSGEGNKNKGYEKGLLDIYKEYLGITIPLTIIVALFAYIFIRLIIILIYATKKANESNIYTWFGKGENDGSSRLEIGHFSYWYKVSEGVIAIATFGYFELLNSQSGE